MLEEAVASLNCRPGGAYVDGTLGGAGHARAVCDRIMPDGLLIAFDQDRDAIDHAQSVLAPFRLKVHLFHGSYTDLPEYLTQLRIARVDGILLDLGLSQHQLEESGRGFSFQRDEPLDMRMDTRTPTSARDLIADLDEAALARIFKEYGEERFARRIARRVVATRQSEPVTTSRQLAELIRQTVPAGSAARQKIHPATRVFMALRIAVNRELERLEQFLSFAPDLLAPGGRLVILSFHSLEDRLVKQRFKELSKGCICPPELLRCGCGARPKARLVTKKALRPSDEEVKINPMARSTRLRAIEMLDDADR
jgi:16S rRNA (cytosine1402-N4)-methyltransferase